MMDKFKKMMMKKAKEGKFLSDSDKEAKMDILSELKELASDAMGSDLKKVTVAADSAEGLKAGLEKAKEVVEKKEEADETECEMEDEEGYDQEMEEPEMSKEDRIKMLEDEIAGLRDNNEGME